MTKNPHSCTEHVAGRDRLAALEQIAQQRLSDLHPGDGDMTQKNPLQCTKEGVFPDKRLIHLEGPTGSKAGRNFGHSPRSPEIPGAEISPAPPGMTPSNGKQGTRP